MTVSEGDVLRTSCNFELANGTLYQNIYHHKRVGSAVKSDSAHVVEITDWADALYAEIDDLVLSNVIEQLCFVDKVVWDTDKWVVVENIGTFTVDFTPTAVVDGLPHTTAPFIIFKTDRPQSVGRKFLFPFAETEQDESILIAGAVTAMIAFGFDAMQDIPLEVENWLEPGIPRTGFDVWLPFTVAIINDVLGTQRRRRPGVGA